MKNIHAITSQLLILACAISGAQANTETEPNNTFSTANSVTFFGRTNHNIVFGTVGGENDTYDYFNSFLGDQEIEFRGGYEPEVQIRLINPTSIGNVVVFDRILTRVFGNQSTSVEVTPYPIFDNHSEYFVRNSRSDFRVRSTNGFASEYGVFSPLGSQQSSWSPPTAVGDTVTVSGLANGATGEFVVVNLSGDEITRGYVAPGIETTFSFANNGIYIMLFSQANGKLISDYTRPENDPLRDPDGSYLKYGSGGNYLRTGSGILYADVTVNGVRRTTDVPLAFAVGVVPEPATIIALSLGLAATLRKRKSK